MFPEVRTHGFWNRPLEVLLQDIKWHERVPHRVGCAGEGVKGQFWKHLLPMGSESAYDKLTTL